MGLGVDSLVQGETFPLNRSKLSDLAEICLQPKQAREATEIQAKDSAGVLLCTSVGSFISGAIIYTLVKDCFV